MHQLPISTAYVATIVWRVVMVVALDLVAHVLKWGVKVVYQNVMMLEIVLFVSFVQTLPVVELLKTVETVLETVLETLHKTVDLHKTVEMLKMLKAVQLVVKYFASVCRLVKAVVYSD